jgi:hypothetical protein
MTKRAVSKGGRDDEPDQLYRCYAEDGRLLYVGINFDAPDAPPPGKVASIRIEHFATCEEAVAAARAAIVCEEPLYNVTLPPGGGGH